MLPYEAVTGYTEGAVIIDLVNPLTNALLWRGSGTATLTDNATENVKQLVKVADAIISQLPHSLRLAVAPRP
jgi:hypothetical protein